MAKQNQVPMTKNRRLYYQNHEKTVIADVKAKMEERDFVEVRNIFLEYGRFLERHEEALAVLA